VDGVEGLGKSSRENLSELRMQGGMAMAMYYDGIFLRLSLGELGSADNLPPTGLNWWIEKALSLCT
jgi:hypothetical protein